MKHARVMFEGRVWQATPVRQGGDVDERLRLSDGREVSGAQVQWLPPVEPQSWPRTLESIQRILMCIQPPQTWPSRPPSVSPRAFFTKKFTG